MPTVPLQLPNAAYDIVIQPGCLNDLGRHVREAAPHDKACLIVDANIEASLGRIAARSLEAAGYKTTIAVMPIGEEHKTLGTVRGLYEVMLTDQLERKSPVIALGGGITGDTAGFVAASYLRGVPFIQVPTTLLAMVDASVGGKTGVNVPQGKNLIGAFHQPKRVLIDTDTLRTLPDRELRCGLAECVKHGVIRDAQRFAWMQEHAASLLAMNPEALVELVEWNVKIKASVVEEDEKEAGVRAHLNFGHTFGHAIEAATEYGTWHHGEAVALGMVAAARLAATQGICEDSVPAAIIALLKAVGLPTHAKKLPPGDVLLARMRMDKKVADGKVRLILPTRMGEVALFDDIADDAIKAACDGLRKAV